MDSLAIRIVRLLLILLGCALIVDGMYLLWGVGASLITGGFFLLLGGVIGILLASRSIKRPATKRQKP